MLLLAATNEVWFVAIPIGAVLIVLLTAILTSSHRRALRDEMEATLKMEMIQRGMSADDIQKVLSARLGGSLTRDLQDLAVKLDLKVPGSFKRDQQTEAHSS
jgi:hypothetical protein